MERKIKVLQIVGGFTGGGLESFVMSHYKYMADRVDCTFVAYDTSTIVPYDDINKYGGKIIFVPNIKHLHKFNKALDKILKEGDYDIIHSHLNTLGVFPLRMAKKNHYPIRISHSHSASNKKEFKRHIAKTILKKFSRKYANVYFACSEVAGRFQFGNKAYDEGKVKIIHNGVEIDRFIFDEDARNRIRKALGYKDTDFVVGTVGRLVVTKNHNFILDIAKKDKENQYLIVGNGPCEEELNKRIKELGLTNAKVFVPTEDIGKYYSAFDSFVMPSLYEGLGLAAVEAETNGIYALLSEFVPDVTLFTKYGEYLPLGEENVDKWIEAIHKRMPRVDNVEKVKENGYDIKTSADNLYNEYLKLLQK